MSESVEAEAESKHTTLIFIAVTASTAAVTYNSMAVITAIPVMKAEFNMSLTMAQWIMNVVIPAGSIFAVCILRKLYTTHSITVLLVPLFPGAWQPAGR